MSRLSHHGDKKTAEQKAFGATAVENFMGGTSYTLSPLESLRIIAASSIFGEPQYYRDGEDAKKTLPDFYLEDYSTRDSVEVFTEAIDAALDADFKGTLDLALRLRTEFMMRLNPSVIWVRASMHPKRAEFNEKNPGYMKEIGKKIAMRPDDITNQFEYYAYIKGSKNGLSSIVKRTWAEKLESFSRYQLNKYKGKRLIDLVRISHANSEDLNELLKTGTIKVEESEKTWESLKSEGKTWNEILSSIKIPHMALLRNLRGIFKEIEDRETCNRVLADLLSGVPTGKQFPFRYWSAFRAIENAEDLNFKTQIMDALQQCIEISIDNFPKLSGKVISLCDNSGSAHGAFNSEYGTVKVSEIANLSAIITGSASEEGYIGVFGDKLEVKGVSKMDGVLTQLKSANNIGDGIGHSTENGVWLFWDKAIKNKEHWDTVFIYSDMQAGHGGLYGTDAKEYKDFIYGKGESSWGRHIDVFALVQKYRKEVNPKVSVFTVQVAGYNNSVLPENLYRGAILAGWTGKEAAFAKEIIDTWEAIEKK